MYIENVKVARVSELDPSLKCEIQKKHPHLNSVSLSKTVHLHGTQYVASMILSAGQCSGLPEFHKIVTILANAEEVTFICKRLSSWYIEHFRSYELVEYHCAKKCTFACSSFTKICFTILLVSLYFKINKCLQLILRKQLADITLFLFCY